MLYFLAICNFLLDIVLALKFDIWNSRFTLLRKLSYQSNLCWPKKHASTRVNCWCGWWDSLFGAPGSLEAPGHLPNTLCSFTNCAGVCLSWASLHCVCNVYRLSHSHSVTGRTRPGGADAIAPLIRMKTYCCHLHTTFGFSHHKKTLCVFLTCLASFDCWTMSRSILNSMEAYEHPKTM